MNKFKIEKPRNVNQRITVRVDPEMHEKIFKIAQSNDISVNTLIISCIKFAFDNMDE